MRMRYGGCGSIGDAGSVSRPNNDGIQNCDPTDTISQCSCGGNCGGTCDQCQAKGKL